MRKLHAKDGTEFLVDDGDVGLVMQCKWYIGHNGYVYSTSKGGNVRLHRLIMGAKKGEVVDHIDHNPLNNTRKNLRKCTSQQNNFHRKPVKTEKSSSQYKGVILKNGRWNACMRINGIKKSLGTFDSEIDAAKAYDNAARSYQGEFAYLNFQEGED